MKITTSDNKIFITSNKPNNIDKLEDDIKLLMPNCVSWAKTSPNELVFLLEEIGDKNESPNINRLIKINNSVIYAYLQMLVNSYE